MTAQLRSLLNVPQNFEKGMDAFNIVVTPRPLQEDLSTAWFND